MHAFLVQVETWQLSTFVRESGSIWAFPMFLFLHTLGVSVLAGASTIISFALLGMWPKTPLQRLEAFFPVIWAGFALNLATGVAMFMKDASVYGANVDFYVKLGFVVGGVIAMRLIHTQVFKNPTLDKGPLPGRARTLAWASLVCWFGAIVAGRLIAYVGPVAGL